MKMSTSPSVRGASAFQFIGGQIPDRVAVAAHRFRQVFDRRPERRDRLELRSTHGSRYFSKEAGVEGGGHDRELQIGTRRRLELQGAGERDVAVEMALVKFIK